MKASILAAGLLLLLLVPMRARADLLSITLDSFVGTPGSQVTVYGTVTNTSLTDTAYLNQPNVNVVSPLNGVSPDIAAIQNLWFGLGSPIPLDLLPSGNPGLDSYTGALFILDIAAGTPPGAISGTLEILGDTTNLGGTDKLGGGIFGGQVVPEGSSLAMLAAGGLPMLAALRRRRRIARA